MAEQLKETESGGVNASQPGGAVVAFTASTRRTTILFYATSRARGDHNESVAKGETAPLTEGNSGYVWVVKPRMLAMPAQRKRVTTLLHTARLRRKASQKIQHLRAIVLPTLLVAHCRQVVDVLVFRISFQHLRSVAGQSRRILDCRKYRALEESGVHADFLRKRHDEGSKYFAATDIWTRAAHAAKSDAEVGQDRSSPPL